MKTFVVKRSRWLRGKHGVLRNLQGKQCCLGFVGRQCGVPVNDLLGTELPNDLASEQWAKYPLLTRQHWSDFAKINDDSNINDSDRERRLKTLAKEAGFRFRFC